MEKRKIILDCNPGHDDAIAIMVAGAHPAIDLLGITITAGNQTMEKTLKNGLNMCQALGLDVPVYKGMSKPMIKPQVVAENIHGETGLDGPVFPETVKNAEDKHAVNYIIDTLLESDGDITLVATAPLTDLAMAMQMEPAIIPKIREIVLMGGAYGIGNCTPAAEFNMYADPEAGKIVFGSGVPVVMMGLDLTNQTNCSMDIIERMEGIGNKAGKLFGDIMRFTHKTQSETYGLDGGPVHDVTCVAYLIDPTIFEVKPMYTEVDATPGPSYGRTLCDYYGITGHEPNALVGMGLDHDRFWNLIHECVAMYD